MEISTIWGQMPVGNAAVVGGDRGAGSPLSFAEVADMIDKGKSLAEIIRLSRRSSEWVLGFWHGYSGRITDKSGLAEFDDAMVFGALEKMERRVFGV